MGFIHNSSTLLEVIRFDMPGIVSMISFTCMRSDLDALLPVEKMEIHIRSQQHSSAATNMLTAVVFPKRRGVVT
jgi:hypothetical protein